MFGENKNLGLKDISSPSPLQGEGGGEVNNLGRVYVSYTKTQKLITALYMVTDIMDKDEPIRSKLRTLGLEILSDISMSKAGFDIRKIDQAMSFLDIASALNFISEMNSSILKKEFLELKKSIQESNVKPTWLEGFLEEEFPLPLNKGENERGFLNSPHPNPLLEKERGNTISKRHTRIGVQKGSTLMKALSDIKDIHKDNSVQYVSGGSRSKFDILKKQRRDNIINIIKDNGESSTIKDIKTKINTGVDRSLVCSEKTLQRELMSMTKDGVLNKTGEKRWSRYFLIGSRP